MKRDTKAFWSAFGLAFESGIELPEMNQVTGVPADIEIVPGKVPRHVENAFYACPWYEAAENQFLIRVPGIASFHVENGNRIVAEGSDGASSEDVRVFLLNTVLPALLLQRGMVALHGAAAVINGQGTAILGASQSGKTTLALALHDRGCKLLADEVLAVTLRDGKAVLLPGIHQLNVWADTLKGSGRDKTRYLPVRRSLEKYAVREAGMFYENPVPLSRVLILKRHNKADALRVSVTGAQKFSKLLQNIPFADLFAKEPAFFKTCAETARSALFLEVTYFQEAGRINDLADSLVEGRI